MEKDVFYQPSTINQHPLSLRELLTQATQLLHAAGVPSPEVDARELVLLALGLGRTALLTRGNEQVAGRDAEQVLALIAKRAARIPLQHLLGEVEWGGIRLKTDARALIPRPETELLLELALRAAEGRRQRAEGKNGVKESSENTAYRFPPTTHHPPLTALDIGTGTGALALGFKKARPEAQVWATDISPDALALARENAALNELDVNFRQGNLLAGLIGPFDLIVSNPPYLPESDAGDAQPEVQHDPTLALYSGADGLKLTRELVQDAAAHLSPTGTLLLELDPRNVHQLAGEMQDWKVEVVPDLTGRDRFLHAVLQQS